MTVFRQSSDFLTFGLNTFNIVESIKTSDGNVKAIMRGLVKVKIDKFSAQENLLTCKALIIQDIEEYNSSVKS